MADIGTAIRSVLAADGSVAGQVGTRIYADRLPKGVTYPAIHFEHYSQSSTQHMTGLSGLADSYLEVICHATTRTAATTLAEYVRLALSRYEGTSSGVVVEQILPMDGRVDVEEPTDQSDKAIYSHEREFHAWYREATS